MSDPNAANQSTDRLLRIVEVMAETGKPMRLNEIASESGVSSSTAMRMLNTLIRNEYARQDPETTLYSLTMKFLKIGTSIRENLTVNQILHPYLQEVSKRLNCSSALAVLDGEDVVYIDECVSSKQMLRFYHHLGHHYSLVMNASGKNFLARFPKTAFNDYCKRHKFECLTPKSIANKEDLQKDLNATIKRGYSLNNEEGLLGTRCFAVPIFNSRQEILASLSVSGTVYQLPLEQIPTMVSVVNEVLAHFYKEYEPVLTVDSIFEL